MAIRRIGEADPIVLDEQSPAPQSTLRQISSDESIVLDQEPMPSEQPEARHGILANIASRTLGLVADGVAGAGDLIEDGGDYLDRNYPIPYFEKTEEQIQQESVRPVTNYISEGLVGLQEKINYQPTVSWDDVKSNPISMNTPTFIAESGVAMVPDMLASMYALPAYVLSRTNDIADTRAENDGRENGTLQDMATVAPVALATAGLERFGAGKLLPKGNTASTVAGRIGSTAGIESGTEFVEEVAEYGAETIGTQTGFDAKTAIIDRGLPGALVGGSVGAGGRTITEILTRGGTNQSMGSDQGEAPVSVAPEDQMPTRDDLSKALTGEAEGEVQNAEPSPEQAQESEFVQPDIMQGENISQVNRYGEIVEGEVQSVQQVDGETSYTVVDRNGVIETIFSTEGQIEKPKENQLVMIWNLPLVVMLSRIRRSIIRHH